jgi:hypothetical protein
MFSIFFVVMSLVDGRRLFLDYSWADITLYPGVILFINFVSGISRKRKIFYFFGVAFIIYLMANSLLFINIPENFYCIPRKELARIYSEKAKFYLSRGEKGQAKELLRLSHEQ